MIGVDYETYLIGNGTVFPKPVCLSAYDGQETFLMLNGRDFLTEYLNKELIIAQNAVFECGVTITHYPELTDLVFDALDNGLIHCTKINEALWNTQRKERLNKLSLAGLVQHYFDEDISAGKGEDAWRMRYSELDGVPIEDWPKEAVDYAIDDSIWAYKIKQKQKDIDQTLSLKSAVYLNLMGAQGFNIDRDRVDLLEKEVTAFMLPHYEYLAEHGFCDIVGKKKTKKVKKFKEYLEGLGIQLRYTKTGGISTDGEALTAYLSEKDDPIVKAFAGVAKYANIQSNYVKNLKGSDVIYSQYNTTLQTGRTSSSGSKLFDSVNIQNPPREVEGATYDVRNCFVPRKGFKICAIDYSGLELCSAAHQLYNTLGYSKMREMLNEGDKPADLHSKLAAKINGVTYEEFMKNKDKDARQKAKPLNLSFPGGVGYDTMRYLMYKAGVRTNYRILETAKRKKDLYYFRLNLPGEDLRIKRTRKWEYALVQDELVLLKRYMFDLYPELEEFLKETHTKFQTGENKYVKNEFGEWEEEPMHMYDTHGFKRDQCNYTALCNGFLMQTPSAVGAKEATSRVIRSCWDNPDIFPQAFIHDEIVFEVREGRYDLIDKVANIMVEEMQKTLTSVRIAVEASMTDQWQKGDGSWTKQYWKDI